VGEGVELNPELRVPWRMGLGSLVGTTPRRGELGCADGVEIPAGSLVPHTSLRD